MAKGGGGLVVVLGGAAALGCGYLYLTGKLPGFGQGVPEAGQLPAPDTSKAEAFIGTREFYTMIVAAVLATVGVVAWKRIGGFGRALVLVCAAVAVTAWLVR